MKMRVVLCLMVVCMVLYGGTAWGFFEAGLNNFFGGSAGASITTGSYDTFIGGDAGLFDTTGSYNTFVGFAAGLSNTEGNYNTFMGVNAGHSNTTGFNNNFMGYHAGYYNTTGYNNNLIGYQAGYSNTTGSQNNFIGYQAGYSNTTGSVNNFMGTDAGYHNTTGSGNNFIGYQAGVFNTTGVSNNFVGFQAGYHNTEGNANTFLGYQAGYSDTTGGDNTFIGQGAGYNNSTGSWNNFMGSSAGTYNTGSRNNFVGYHAGYLNTGPDNTFIGDSAGYLNTSGWDNTFLGSQAGNANTTGGANTFLGYVAGQHNISGNYNTFLGYQTGVWNITGINNTFLGSQAGASATGSNNVFMGFGAGANEMGSNKLYIANSNTSSPLIYGDFGSSIMRINGSLGVGKSPFTAVDVNGTVSATSFVGNGSGLTNVNALDPRVGILTSGQWCTSDGSHVNCAQSPPVTVDKVGTLTAGQWCSSSDGSHVTCTQAPPVTVDKVGTLTSAKWCTSDGSKVNCTQNAPVTTDKVGTNTLNSVPRWNGSQLVSGSITDTGSDAVVNGNFGVFSPNVAPYADILGRNQVAGTGIDVETAAGAPPAGPVQGINGEFLVKYTPGSPISNNFNTFRMTARTDATVMDQLNGHLSAGTFQAQHNGGGTASTVVGLITSAYLLGTGNVTNAIGVMATNPTRSGSGVISNAYGVDIQPQRITGVTNAYGVYQEGASDVNYFAGSIGVGTRTPTHPIEAANGAYLSAGGQWINGSSRQYKDNIRELTTEEALSAFNGLNPVAFTYKAGGGEQHIGFIAEDVPELVAMKDRKGLSPMDIVALLTKVVQEQQRAMQEQQKTISNLREELDELKGKVR